ncbi:hypothetical protein M409DRAFT_21160 [Zasmidium cellare ATCC 36951]|uniref:Haloacid dehalogenase n=1 Tax=Zasmidium cellare ATCC 36951 TaxID=1080233 RepID=A0A6A6CRJ7_ZASCE|nr:uncharacterized protein M409DRAFT_21160 [Zasmidium cellare ATCC 36951]KAF2168409.1 hypothetical protein M409DRAFT_21160 [Zasmidium cellare ATCC 36951]
MSSQSAIRPGIKVLFFDVFGTCVQQRKPVADELYNATKEALKAGEGIDEEVRRKAEGMTWEDWDAFGVEWNAQNETYKSSLIAQHATVDWPAVDAQRIALLPTLLAQGGLILLSPSASDANKTVLPGSLFTPPQLQHLAKIWHRLPAWPDTIPGLEQLNKKFTTATLSNTYNALITSLVTHSRIPFQHTFSADLFPPHAYKPHPGVYLGAAERLGVRPEECALVAAHLGDLRGAKGVGFQTVYVVREGEEKSPGLRGTGIEDVVVDGGVGGEGFKGVAGVLGVLGVEGV